MPHQKHHGNETSLKIELNPFSETDKYNSEKGLWVSSVTFKKNIMGQGSSRAGRLTKEDVLFLKANTRYDEDTIQVVIFFRNAWSDVGDFQEWYKGFISDCPNGKLTPSAFVKIYSQCFPSGNARDFCDHIFRTFDTDGNGYIDFREFLLAIDITSSGTAEEKLGWAFR